MVVYVCQIDFATTKALSNILDPDRSWEQLAGVMNMDAEVIFLCRQAPQRGQSPSSELLRIWGSRGYTMDDLFKVCYKCRHFRAMEVLKPLVDKKLHKLLDRAALSSSDLQTTTAMSELKVSISDQPKTNTTSKTSTNQATSPNHRLASATASTNHRLESASSSKPPGSMASASQSSRTKGASPSSAVASSLLNTLSVNYDELMAATNNFSKNNVVGRGGYGIVYKAVWKHTEVAVKRFPCKNGGGSNADQISQSEKERVRQSLMELRTLPLYRHDNVVPLYGYCLDGPEPCLLYQLMVNGSLEDRLQCRNGTTPLTWKQRKLISTGAAKGLHFLHTIKAEPLIHGDIKSANILLDSHMEPKIGDFGLSRPGQVELPGGAPPMIASHIKGTLAYLPPEFIRCKHLSTKLDVFSFGVVLMEVATGLKAYCIDRSPENLVEFIHKTREDFIDDWTKLDQLDQEESPDNNSFWNGFDPENLHKLADQKAGDVGKENSFGVYISVALACCQNKSELRPSADDILKRLCVIECS